MCGGYSCIQLPSACHLTSGGCCVPIGRSFDRRSVCAMSNFDEKCPEDCSQMSPFLQTMKWKKKQSPQWKRKLSYLQTSPLKRKKTKKQMKIRIVSVKIGSAGSRYERSFKEVLRRFQIDSQPERKNRDNLICFQNVSS